MARKRRRPRSSARQRPAPPPRAPERPPPPVPSPAPPPSRREGASFALALAAHVVVLGALSLLPRPAPPPAPPLREAALEVDLLPPPEAPEKPRRGDPPEPPPPSAPSEFAASLAPAEAPVARAAPAPPAAAAPEAPPGTEAPPAPAAEAPKGWSADPGPPSGAPASPGGDRLGMPTWMGGRPLWTEPGSVGPDLPNAPAPRSGPDPEAAGKALRGTLRTKDRALGLDLPAATTVENAVTDAVRATATPLRARATFEIKLSPDGRVEGAKVLGVTGGDAASWNKALEKAKASLGKKRLPMGAGARGATVRVKVESKVLYPGGTAKRAEVKPVCANEIAGEILAQLKNPANPEEESKLRKQLAALPCIPIALTGQLDPVNIGAHASRVVRASREVLVEGEQALPAGPVLPVDTRPRWMQKKLPSGAPSLYEYRRKPKWERERDKRREGR